METESYFFIDALCFLSDAVYPLLPFPKVRSRNYILSKLNARAENREGC